MIVYLGNKKLNQLYSGDKEVLNPTTVAQTNNKLDIEYLIVGGGGGGGRGGGGGAPRFNGSGGGGGAGGVITGSAIVFGGVYPVTVGDGGAQAADNVKAVNGQTSSFFNKIAMGGGGGGSAGDRDTPTCTFGSGSNGASGGGAGSWVTTWGCNPSTGSGIIGQGFDGDITGGGGATSKASGATGGSGYVWLDGNTYSEGGNGSGGSQRATIGSGGKGAAAFPSPGATVGNEGTVIIRYQATSSIATGGTITSAGGYIYHFFPIGSYDFSVPSKG